MFLVSVYILAKVEAGKDREVLQEIKTINGVKKVSATYGTYDLCIEVHFQTIEELDAFVFDKLRVISKIKETVPVICSEIMS